MNKKAGQFLGLPETAEWIRTAELLYTLSMSYITLVVFCDSLVSVYCLMTFCFILKLCPASVSLLGHSLVCFPPNVISN